MPGARFVRTRASPAPALSYDEFLDEDPELLEAAASAVPTEPAPRHLEVELRLRVDEMTRRSYRRERRRIDATCTTARSNGSS